MVSFCFRISVANTFENSFGIFRGAFSEVYKCVNKVNNNCYAVKCISKKDLNGKMTSLENEIAILKR